MSNNTRLKQNAGLLFYREYYNHGDLNEDRLEAFVKNGKLLLKEVKKDGQVVVKGDKDDKQFFVDASNEIINFQWDKSLNTLLERAGNHGFRLETIYPGLLIGTGYNHQTGSTGEFKSGFYFDHTTGLPIIPGSSVKGVLRSVFPNRDKSENGVVKEMKTKFVCKLLQSVGVTGAEYNHISGIEKAIFEGLDDKSNPLPMHQHDVFHDAYVSDTNDANGGIFEEDYITPHGGNPLKNPTPVRFLKIRGGVTFQFCFDLKDTVVQGLTVTAAQKEKLFECILKKTGIGAKTNTGYGHFK